MWLSSLRWPETCHSVTTPSGDRQRATRRKAVRELAPRPSAAFPRGPRGTAPCMGPANPASMFEELLRRTHLSAPDQLATIVAEAAESMGARDVVLYVVDYELTTLIPVPARDAGGREPLSVGGTVGGRAFMTTSIMQGEGEPTGGAGPGRGLWLPLM